MSAMLNARLADAEAAVVAESASSKRLSITMQSVQTQSDQIIASLQIEITNLQHQHELLTKSASITQE